MIVKFSCDNAGHVEIPDENLQGVYQPVFWQRFTLQKLLNKITEDRL